MARGMPIGAATNVTVNVRPTIMNVIPIIAATIRPVNLIMKLKIDQTRTNGRSKRGVFRWLFMEVPYTMGKMYRQFRPGATKKRSGIFSRSAFREPSGGILSLPASREFFPVTEQQPRRRTHHRPDILHTPFLQTRSDSRKQSTQDMPCIGLTACPHRRRDYR